MFRDIRLHGITENLVEYDAIAVGADTCTRYFFDIDPNGTTSIRLFSPGNELSKAWLWATSPNQHAN